MVAARNSVGYEIEPELLDGFDERAASLPSVSRAVQGDRLRAHVEFIAEREGDGPEHVAERYGFPVVTSQETRVALHAVEELEARAGEPGAPGRRYVATHAPVDLPPGGG